MPTITVTGKGDLGFSPIFGEIKQGQTYTIEEDQFASELFDYPNNYTPPVEPPADPGGA